MSIFRRHYEMPWRPAYEAYAAALWGTAFLWFLYLAVFAGTAVLLTFGLALISLAVGLYRAQQAIRTQAAENVAHRRRAPFDREQIERARRRPPVAHGPGEEALHDALGMREHPVRLRVVVADDRVRELVDERVRGEPQLRHAVRDRVAEQRGTRAGVRGVEEGAEAIGDPIACRHATQAGLVPDALRFREPELSEQEERLARGGRDPVRISATGVQERVGGRSAAGLSLRVADQLVLELERTELLEPRRRSTFGGRCESCVAEVHVVSPVSLDRRGAARVRRSRDPSGRGASREADTTPNPAQAPSLRLAGRAARCR